ncbi:MAG: glycosyltransferase family 4 protein [Thermoplasmata archaeon]
MLRVCISSQTPPLLPTASAQAAPPGGVWRRGRDYEPSVGGVVPMMRALLRAAGGRWMSPDPIWVATGLPDWPESLRTDEGFRVVFARLPADQMPGYTAFKQAIWDVIHDVAPFGFRVADYRSFLAFGQTMASRLLDFREEVDLYYVNDFQQIQVGPLVGPAAPAVLRWHLPFRMGMLPDPVRRFFLKSIEGFDGIVVSARRDLEALLRQGYSGRAVQVYPYLDPEEFPPVSPTSVEALRLRFALGDRPVLTCVARMDPQKRQDLLVRAFARVHRLHPRALLLLVGNGSFSSAAKGGLGSGIGPAWRRKLEAEVRALKIQDSVRFAGYLPGPELAAAYAASTALVLPSPLEGFGLVGVEAWAHGIPILVTDGSGIAEAVQPEVNGLVAAAGSIPHLVRQMDRLLRDPERSRLMGQQGRLTSQSFHAASATRRLKAFFEEIAEEYSRASSGAKARRRTGRTAPPARRGRLASARAVGAAAGSGP